MKNQNTKTREECKKGILSGAILTGLAALFMLYVAENGEIPLIHQSLGRGSIPSVLCVGIILMVIGICVAAGNKKRLNQIEREEQARRNSASSGVSYYFCEHCGKKLRVSGGRGRIQITCPMCGHQFFVKR